MLLLQVLLLMLLVLRRIVVRNCVGLCRVLALVISVVLLRICVGISRVGGSVVEVGLKALGANRRSPNPDGRVGLGPRQRGLSLVVGKRVHHGCRR